jgi:lycopene beta-cyclase
LPRVCLLEPRTEYHNDRTWCFWDTEQHPFRHLIAYRWPQWRVSIGESVVSQSANHLPYAMLPAGRVYQHALASIESCPEFSLQQGVRVIDIVESADSVRILTETRQWCAKAVIDTRPPGPTLTTGPDQNPGFWQVFTGYEIYCPNHGFDIRQARLMDFQPNESHVCFVYLLPFDADNFLVEWTEFYPTGTEVEMPDCTLRLEAWLENRNFRGYEIKRSESAALPMIPLDDSQASGRVIRAGVGAGWMRAATGYHFATCQRGAAVLAERVLSAAASGHWFLDPPTVRKPWLNWMDRVFLRALHRHPESGPDWFLALFRATTAEQMARFMNDVPNLGDAVCVATALPALPFLGATFR